MTEKKAKDNMELWDKVCKTDPAVTKRVTLRGGFTSIDAQTQIKRATELWGSYGSKWGVKDCHYDFINTPSEKGEQTGIYLTAVFYCPISEFEIASDMFYGPHNDCMKKLLTDVTTKALSKLGFNSDVFEGKFDDDKYIAEMKREFEKSKSKPKKKLPQAKLPNDVNLSEEHIDEDFKLSDYFFTKDEIKNWEDWKATPKEKLDYAEEEAKHRDHLIMSFGEMKPALLSLIREVRKEPKKYDWEAFKKSFLLNDIWKELKEENQISTLKQWIKENG